MEFPSNLCHWNEIFDLFYWVIKRTCFPKFKITNTIKIPKWRCVIKCVTRVTSVTGHNNTTQFTNAYIEHQMKISCRKIPLNIGSLFQNLICTGNLSTLLQLLILNKAYYLEIKIGLINESHQICSTVQPFWNYFWTGRGETTELYIWRAQL